MRTRPIQNFRLISAALVLLALSETTFAQNQVREVDEHFIEERDAQSQLFKTLPGTHITPVNDRLIFTLMVNTLHARVKGRDDLGQPNDEKLRIRGYNLAPYIAISGKHFGGGLSGEVGEGWSRYDSPSDQLKERSALRYHGLGGHVFYTPMPADSRFRLTFVAGTKVLKASHRATSNQDRRGYSANDWEEQAYMVNRSRIGSNLNIRVLESLSIIPWIDHTYTYSGELEGRLNTENRNDRVLLNERYRGDNEIFWQPGSQWQYGLDAALRINRFEIHFGNLIGSLMNRNQGSERVADHSYSVSVIFLTPTEKKRGI